MKNRILKAFFKGIVAVVCGVVLTALHPLQVYAYNYSRTGATEAGTVTIQEVAGSSSANGYSSLSGYRVTYTIEQSNWTGFYDAYGGYFLTGNQLNVSGGCHFGYHPSNGQIWDDGAIALGILSDGVQAARCDVASGKVSYSFTVTSIDKLPTYIAYAYQPNQASYIHLSSEKGTNGHVWYYAKLKNKTVQAGSKIDHEAPAVSVSVVPKGKIVNAGEKVWSTVAEIIVNASDSKARPEGIRIYNGSSLLQEIKNPDNAVSIEGTYEVTQNGSYQADAYDKLNNASNKTTVSVTCIDREGPIIHSIGPDTTEYVREVTLRADVSDEGCGLHEKAYSWNGEPFSENKEWNVKKNGTYTLLVRDALGNESAESFTVSNVDEDAPEITYRITLTGKQVTYGGVNWATNAKLSAESVDEKSGVAKLELIQNDGRVLAEKKASGKAEKLSLEEFEVKKGVYGFRSADMQGNISQTEWIRLPNVDSEAPVIKEIKGSNDSSGMVVISVSAQDASGGIGLADTAYSFDGGKTWQKSNTYTATKNGVYEIAVRDRLDQAAAKTYKVTSVGELGNNAGRDQEPKDSEVPKKSGKFDDTEKNTVSGNTLTGLLVRRGKVSLEDALSGAQEQEVTSVPPADELQSEKDVKTDSVKTAATAVFGVLFTTGCGGLILYLLLFYLRHSCVLYEPDDNKERKRLCRLLIHKEDRNWLIKVPDDKLGLSGMGKYLLVFHPAFLKEEEPDAVIVEIDGRRLREKPMQEILISI